MVIAVVVIMLVMMIVVEGGNVGDSIVTLAVVVPMW